MNVIVALVLCCSCVIANAMEVGATVGSFTLNDQFDRSASLTDDTSLLIVASSRGAAGIVDDALKDRPQGWLEARDALYVADVSKMPGFITNRLLVPSMRKASYRVLLDRQGRVAPAHMTDRERVLVLRLQDREVVDKRTFEKAEALREALEEAGQ